MPDRIKSLGIPWWLARLIGVNVLLFASLVCLLELFFGRWIKNSPVTAVPEIARTAGLRFDFRTHGFTGEDVLVSFERDQDGLRGRSPDKAKPLILVLGGSTGIEQNVPLESTWAETLEAQLSSVGLDYDVANASVSGHTLFGNQYSIQHWLSRLPLRPALLVIYYGHNDAVYTFNGEGPAGRDYSAAASFDLKEQFLRRSALLMLYRELVGNYRAIVKGNSHLYDYKPAALPLESEGATSYKIPRMSDAAKNPKLVRKSIDLLYRQIKKSYPETPAVFVAQSNPNCLYLSGSRYVSRGGPRGVCSSLGALHNFVQDYLSQVNDQLFYFIPLYLENPYDRFGASDAIHTNSTGAVAVGRALAPHITSILLSRDKVAP